MNFLVAFGVSFLRVWLKATQQLQVVNAEYAKMPAISMLMAACEVFVVVNVAASTTADLLLMTFCIGLGGGLGSILGTWLHERRSRPNRVMGSTLS